MSKPLIVQSDLSLLLDVHEPDSDLCRADIALYAELEKSLEHMHTYRITPLSLWNAASAGLTTAKIERQLDRWSRYPVPEHVLYSIRDISSRFGKIILTETDDPDTYFLEVPEKHVYEEILSRKTLTQFLDPEDRGFRLSIFHRGTIKQELMKTGYPVDDVIPLTPGSPLTLHMRERTKKGGLFLVRKYQEEAAGVFPGFGVIVLPCGAGKTIVGMRVMDLLQTSTLILTANVAAVHQWMEELEDKTSLSRDAIGEYTGDRKEIKPVTIATYQILTWRNRKTGEHPHFQLFRENRWGLIIYDEVHLLPAPVFRVTAEIQAVRRLGLTATLVREDGKEGDVFALIGPKRYDVPWKELEAKGWIAEADCYEIRVPLPESLKVPYASAGKRKKFRIAAENPYKVDVAEQLIENHPDEPILVIGQYLDQLQIIAAYFKVPLITGKTPHIEREKIYRRFREGKEHIIVVSKVANFAIDLPDASVAVQVSGTFGSRQEEAQRLGRLLRPKKRNSCFYSIISHYTVEEDFGANRQKFLTEQGYKYHIELWSTRDFSGEEYTGYSSKGSFDAR